MLNYIWAFMILIGITYGTFTGNLDKINDALINSSKEAVSLSITMLGVISFWLGIMEIGRKAGIIGRMTRKLKPIVDLLFPELPENHRAREYITTNIISNILGLGWAATPPGLKAMEELRNLNIEKNGYGKAHIASNEMCTFLIINISSLQLIPINIIAYRSQYGSCNPTVIVGPAIVATLVSTITGVIFCKIWGRKKH